MCSFRYGCMYPPLDEVAGNDSCAIGLQHYKEIIKVSEKEVRYISDNFKHYPKNGPNSKPFASLTL